MLISFSLWRWGVIDDRAGFKGALLPGFQLTGRLGFADCRSIRRSSLLPLFDGRLFFEQPVNIVKNQVVDRHQQQGDKGGEQDSECQ